MGSPNYQLRAIQIAMLFVFAISAYFTYLIFQPAPSFKVQEPIPILNEDRTVHRGESVMMNIKYCAEEQTRQRVEVQLVDVNNENAYTVFVLDESKLDNGCVDNVFNLDSNRFSNFLSPTGDYKIRFKATLQLNPLKTVTRGSETETFRFISE